MSKRIQLILLTSFLVVTMIFESCLSENPRVAIKTEFGVIFVELYPHEAPVTSENFLRYVKENSFENSNFYRTVRMDNQPENEIKIEVIQGGLDFSFPERMRDPIPHETTERSGVLHKDGVISMARWKPGTASSEFFICIGDQPELDFGGRRNPDGQGFAAFGKVISGLEVVKKIQQMPDTLQILMSPVNIENIVMVGDESITSR